MKPSGIEWIGDIPDDWEVKKVKRLFSYQKGKNAALLTKEYISLHPGEYPVLSGQTENDGILGYYESYEFDLDKDSIFVTTVGAKAMSTKLVNAKFSLSQNCALLHKIDEKADVRFLHYALFPMFEWQKSMISLIMQPSLRFEDLDKATLPYPPLKTQERIADYLDEKCGEIDATIAKQKESIEKLKAYKQSLISETVTKGLDKSAPLKPSGIEWIGDIPDDWEVRKLLSIFKEHKDRNKNLEEQNLLSLSYGKIKRKDINNNDGLLPASFETYNIVENGDIVFRLTDLQNDKRSLRTGIVTQRGIITSAYVTIRPKIRLDSRFFHYLYHMYDICKVFYGMGDGVRQGMGFEDLKNIPTLIPPLKTQQKIADYLDSKCSQIDKYITEKQNIIQKLDAYKKSLIFECVTGKFVI